VSTRPTHVAVEAGQLGEYVGYQIFGHLIDKRPTGNTMAIAMLTIAEVEPGELPSTVRIVTAEHPDFHTDIDSGTQVQVFAPLGSPYRLREVTSE